MEKIADIRAYMLYKDLKYMKDYESTDKHQDETLAEIENLDKSEQTQKYLAELRENDKCPGLQFKILQSFLSNILKWERLISQNLMATLPLLFVKKTV